MKLLVSVICGKEVIPAVEGGADIIDIKNPMEGSLGAPYPWVIEEVLNEVGSERETSCAIGDLPNIPGTASLAAAGAAKYSPDYIKLGLYGVSDPSGAAGIIKPAVRAIKYVDPSIGVIACGYGDWKTIGSISPLLLPRIAARSGADGVLIDTINKDGKSLFDFLSEDQLVKFISEAEDQGIIGALAGSLREKHAGQLRRCNPDVVGIRGAACVGNDRKRGALSSERVDKFKTALI